MTEGTMNKYPSTVTGKTIEQKAEEYTNKNDTIVMGFEENLDCTDQMQQAFIDGYHECQKEHEWHYVKDELPTYNGQFYVALKGYKETFILNYDYNETDNMSWLDDDDTNFDDEVYAWCEKLKAPKEIE